MCACIPEEEEVYTTDDTRVAESVMLYKVLYTIFYSRFQRYRLGYLISSLVTRDFEVVMGRIYADICASSLSMSLDTNTRTVGAATRSCSDCLVIYLSAVRLDRGFHL